MQVVESRDELGSYDLDLQETQVTSVSHSATHWHNHGGQVPYSLAPTLFLLLSCLGQGPTPAVGQHTLGVGR